MKIFQTFLRPFTWPERFVFPNRFKIAQILCLVVISQEIIEEVANSLPVQCHNIQLTNIEGRKSFAKRNKGLLDMQVGVEQKDYD